jgi:hypothetical protein
MMNKTGSELSRRFSNRTGSDGAPWVTSRAPEVSATGKADLFRVLQLSGSRHISARWYDVERSYCCVRTLLHDW